MENKDIILEKLEKIEKHIVGLKSIFNVEELMEYTGFKKSNIYKLVHTNEIPYSKPNGKLLFFEREKIDEWLLRNTIKSNDEIKEETLKHIFKKNKKSY